MTLPIISRKIQHVQRYARILEVLAANGFAELAQGLQLDTLIDRGRAALGATPKGPHEPVPLPQRVRMTLEALGPTFVKLGQVMSTRPDLVPADWADEFKQLQNKVPGVEYADIEKTLAEEFPGGTKRLFRSIHKKPLAAGSMAQVHRARLKDGTKIVLKVLRPDIREITAIDMEILYSLAEFVEARFADRGYSPTEVVNEFAKELKREVDMMHEGRSTERLAELFEDDPDVVFPKVYWKATTQSVLAMEELEGVVLADAVPGQFRAEQRRALVRNGARAVFRQCLEFGFFHADPHPGNLIALPGGRIGFIDCGMTGQIDERTARQLADLVEGVATGNLDGVIAAAGAITGAEAVQLEERSLRADAENIVGQFRGTDLKRLNLGRVLQDFFGVLRDHKIRCPADIVLLIKALATIESVGRDLDPSFQMVEYARPFLEELVARRTSFSSLRGRVRRGAMRYLELVEELPAEVRPILSLIRRNKLTVNIEHRGLDRLTRTIEHASRNISFAMIIAGALVGSSILVLAARGMSMPALRALGIAGFVATAVLIVVMLISNRRNRGG